METYKLKSYNTDDYILIDKEDYPSLSQYRWRVKDKGYVYAKINGKTTYIHRLIMNCPTKLTVDHINHNKLDNRRENLRICTYSENNYNRRSGNKNSASKYKGVRKSFLDNKWQSEVCFKGEVYYIGTYYTEEYSALKYNNKALELQLEYAYLNELPYSVDEIIKLEKTAEIQYFKNIKKLSKYKYVSYNKEIKKWFGQKWINGKKYVTDFYNLEEEAHESILKIMEKYK